MNSESLKIESIKDLQRKLSSLIGVSGREEDVSAFILNEIQNNELADKTWIDPLGNVLAIKEGTDKNNRILLDAHMDEIGFMISHVEKKGFLRFVLIGGWDTRILLGQSIFLKSSTGEIFNGIIGSKPPHLSSIEERKKRVDVSEMYIDIGLSSEEEVNDNNITIGTVGTLSSPFTDFPNGMIKGKAFDDRTGCNVILHTLKLLNENEPFNDTVLCNFAVQEEIGGRGAETGAYALKPTIALAIENTTAGDMPGIREAENPVNIGDGPAITVADMNLISHPKVNNRLIKNAEKENINYQIKKPLYGGTDAGKIHVSRSGVPSSVVSVPCRYIHSPTSLLKLQDLYETIRLLDVFLRNPANITFQ
ncbi:MAG: M20/M25/M40 family metallo-hydrolase [Candidatus Lokiarchaeota archaeon]|nr:M20/M25/M40 family metallo-hydrolase [Candidatus Lokiarchaeota archaeon]